MKKLKAQDSFDEPVTATVLAQATERGRNRRTPGLHATIVQYLSAQKSLLIGFADQSAVTLPVKNYPELATLSVDELNQLEIGYGGSALCLDKCDLHVSIAGLMSASVSLMEMAATLIAARKGSRSRMINNQISCENGQKIARPRKLTVTG